MCKSEATLGSFPYCSLPCFLQKYLSLKLELADLPRQLAGNELQGSFCLSFFSLGILGTCFCVYMGSEN